MLDRPNMSLPARAYRMHPFTNPRRLESEGLFIITEAEIDDMLERLMRALDETAAFLAWLS